jgi:hypothetical protein
MAQGGQSWCKTSAWASTGRRACCSGSGVPTGVASLTSGMMGARTGMEEQVAGLPPRPLLASPDFPCPTGSSATPPRWPPRRCCALLPCAAARISLGLCPCPPPRTCLRVGTPVPPPSTSRSRPSPAPVLASTSVSAGYSPTSGTMLGRDDVGDSFIGKSVKWVGKLQHGGRLRAGQPPPALCVAALQSVTRGT